MITGHLKKIIPLLILAALMVSCEKTDTDIIDETELWRPLPVAVRDGSAVELSWVNPVIFDYVLLPFRWVDPDIFEIYMSTGESQAMNKIATIREAKQYSYRMEDLNPGTTYLFAVKAWKKGKTPLMSDTIMIIPAPGAKTIQLLDNKDFPAESGTASRGRDIVAYVNREFTWNNGLYGAMSLFSLNINSGETSIIDTSAYFPDWSPAEMKLVYCSDKHQIAREGYRPQHLYVYNAVTQQRTRLTHGEQFNVNPEFSHDGRWIVYSSDEGSAGFFNIWKISADGSSKARLTNDPSLFSSWLGNVGLGRPSWSPDDSYVYFNVLARAGSANGIYRINIQNGHTEAVISSHWNDVCPAISPDNKNLAFISNRSGSDHIWIFNLSTGKYRQLTGDRKENINSTWGKLEWLDENRLMYGGYSASDSRETLFVTELYSIVLVNP